MADKKTNIENHPIMDDTAEELELSVLRKLIPNFLTLLALMSGLTAIQMAINGKFEIAVLFILVSAILDMLDGATARLLNASSEFGAQLDSLSDFLCFGVAPAFILYIWGLDEAGKLGWIATLAYASACALRLARYNSTEKLKDKKRKWAKQFFSGVPAPAAAGLALFPLFVWFQAPRDFAELNVGLPLIGVWVLVVSSLMVSRIPTWSSKQLRLKPKMLIPSLAFTGLCLAILIHAPWVMLSAISIIYMISLPLAFRYYRKLEKENNPEAEDITDLALGAFDDD